MNEAMEDIFAEADLVWGGQGATRECPEATALLRDLNQKQKKAVRTTEGPVLVIAGAGTGKTTVLTRRIGYIMASRKARASEILAVTFTNKAATEMRERIVRLVGDEGKHVFMGSFHALSMMMLREHATDAGLLNEKFHILDEDDQRHILRTIAAELDVIPRSVPAGEAARRVQHIMTRIMTWKEEGWTPDDVLARISAEESDNRQTANLYLEYQTALANRNCCDFADLILHMIRLFRTRKDIRQKWSRRFKYILVDEFQDTNPLQYQWLEALVGRKRNLCVVGDPDQSIYEWRNARPDILAAFPEKWKNAKVITVDLNYRSTSEILAVANAVVKANKRIGDKLLQSPVRGSNVEFNSYTTHIEEAQATATAIEQMIVNGMKPGEIAILVRSANLMRPFEDQLIKRNIAYSVAGGKSFHQREEVKDALAYLSIALDTLDANSFRRIANKPERNVGEHAATQVTDLVEGAGMDIAQAARHVATHGKAITQRTSVELMDLADMLDDFHDMAENGERPGTLISKMLERVGYLSWRVRMGDTEKQERETSLDMLVAEANGYGDIATYLQDIALMSASETMSSDDRVRLSTIHASKGLEFDVVFTPCLEDGVLPNKRALEMPYGLEEERRIAHVAWTRPRKRLIVSHAGTRHFNSSSPSNLLAEAGLMPPLPASAKTAVSKTKPGSGQAYKFKRRAF